MTEEELSLFSEFLEQREYAGPVKMQNKALKRQHLMKKHNIPTYTSEGSRTVEIEQAKGPRQSRYIPSKWVKDEYGFEWRKKGTGVRIPAVKRTSAQQAQEKAIQEARKRERSIPKERQRYQYGQRDQNRKNLHINITNGEGTWDPGQVREYKGQKHIATRSKLTALRDWREHWLYDLNKNPGIMGMKHEKHIRVKGLE